MSIWSTRVLPRVVDVTCGTEAVSRWRRRCVEGLHGVVVEPGFGSGLNIAHYPEAVTKVYAVDPAMLGRKLAAKRISQSKVDIEFVGLDGQSLALADDSCDSALLTFTLCTIPDHAAALAEIRRVVKPGGTLHFLEHGLARDPAVQRWQHRLTPLQRRVADGCHLNRPIERLIADAGLDIVWSDSGYEGRPKAAAFFTVGRALIA